MEEVLSGNLEELDKMPSIIETMHNGPRDCIDVIENKAMESLLSWTLDFIEGM